MAQEAIAMSKLGLRSTKGYENAIEGRHQLDGNWDFLMHVGKQLFI